MRSLCTATREGPPPAATTESQLTAMKTQQHQKYIKLLKKICMMLHLVISKINKIKVFIIK